MIEIQNERGQLLNLYKDTTIENELNSWLLSEDDSLPGSYSLPFRFPITGNESFLGHKHRPEAGGFSGISVTLSVNGLPMGAAVLRFRVNNQDGDGILFFDGGEVAAKLKSKFIYDAVYNSSYVLCGTHADLPDAMLRTVDPLTNPWPFVFFPVLNEEFCDPTYENPAFNYSHQKYINSWETLFVSKFVADTVSTIGRPIVPFFYLTWVIREVCSYLGFRAEGPWLELPEVKALVMYNEVAMDTSGLFASFTAFARYHVWPMKISDFFKLLRDDMGVGVYFDQTRGVINFHAFVDQSAADESFDFSANLLKGYVSDPISQTGVAIQFPRDTGDDYEKELPPIPDFEIGTAEDSISLTLGTLPMTAVKRPSPLGAVLEALGSKGSRWLVPIARRRGVSLNSAYADMGMYDVSFPPKGGVPKLLSYYGMQADSSGTLYPYGSSLSRNINQARCGAMSLQPDEPDSLFHRFVRPFHEFKVFSKRITLKFILKLGVVSRLRLWQKIGVGSASMVHLPYLISRITYQLPAIEGKVLAEAVLYPLLPPSADYVPKIPTGSVWVRIVFVPIDAEGLYPATVGLFVVKFQLFTSREAVLAATSNIPLTLFYQYKTTGYDDAVDAKTEKEAFGSVVVPAGQFETTLDFPQAFWKSDDPQFWVAYPDQFYIVRSSFQLLPGAGYRII